MSVPFVSLRTMDHQAPHALPKDILQSNDWSVVNDELSLLSLKDGSPRDFVEQLFRSGLASNTWSNLKIREIKAISNGALYSTYVEAVEELTRATLQKPAETATEEKNPSIMSLMVDESQGVKV